jgi:uncharacterized protein (DUF1778 family)
VLQDRNGLLADARGGSIAAERSVAEAILASEAKLGERFLTVTLQLARSYGALTYNKIMAQATQIAAKRARLEARLTDEQKELLQHAADLTGRSLTEFVVSSAQEVAARTVREHEVLALSGRDRKVFLDALLKPSLPSKRLRKAASRYRKITGI